MLKYIFITLIFNLFLLFSVVKCASILTTDTIPFETPRVEPTCEEAQQLQQAKGRLYAKGWECPFENATVAAEYDVHTCSALPSSWIIDTCIGSRRKEISPVLSFPNGTSAQIQLSFPSQVLMQYQAFADDASPLSIGQLLHDGDFGTALCTSDWLLSSQYTSLPLDFDFVFPSFSSSASFFPIDRFGFFSRSPILDAVSLVQVFLVTPANATFPESLSLLGQRAFPPSRRHIQDATLSSGATLPLDTNITALSSWDKSLTSQRIRVRFFPRDFGLEVPPSAAAISASEPGTPAAEFCLSEALFYRPQPLGANSSSCACLGDGSFGSVCGRPFRSDPGAWCYISPECSTVTGNALFKPRSKRPFKWCDDSAVPLSSGGSCASAIPILTARTIQTGMLSNGLQAATAPALPLHLACSGGSQGSSVVPTSALWYRFLGDDKTVALTSCPQLSLNIAATFSSSINVLTSLSESPCDDLRCVDVQIDRVQCGRYTAAATRNFVAKRNVWYYVVVTAERSPYRVPDPRFFGEGQFFLGFSNTSTIVEFSSPSSPAGGGDPLLPPWATDDGDNNTNNPNNEGLGCPNGGIPYFTGDPLCDPEVSFCPPRTEVCLDLNECLSADTNNCHHRAECVNTLYSFQCVCRQPFVGDGVKSCDFPTFDTTDYLGNLTNARAIARASREVDLGVGTLEADFEAVELDYRSETIKYQLDYEMIASRFDAERAENQARVRRANLDGVPRRAPLGSLGFGYMLSQGNPLLSQGVDPGVLSPIFDTNCAIPSSPDDVLATCANVRVYNSVSSNSPQSKHATVRTPRELRALIQKTISVQSPPLASQPTGWMQTLPLRAEAPEFDPEWAFSLNKHLFSDLLFRADPDSTAWSIFESQRVVLRTSIVDTPSSPSPLIQTFKDAVADLSSECAYKSDQNPANWVPTCSADEQAAYTRFIQQYGSHVISEVWLGSRSIDMYLLSLAETYLHGQELSADPMGLMGRLNRSPAKSWTAGSSNSSQQTYDHPDVPVFLSLQSIGEVLNPLHFPDDFNIDAKRHHVTKTIYLTTLLQLQTLQSLPDLVLPATPLPTNAMISYGDWFEIEPTRSDLPTLFPGVSRALIGTTSTGMVDVSQVVRAVDGRSESIASIPSRVATVLSGDACACDDSALSGVIKMDMEVYRRDERGQFPLVAVWIDGNKWELGPFLFSEYDQANINKAEQLRASFRTLSVFYDAPLPLTTLIAGKQYPARQVQQVELRTYSSVDFCFGTIRIWWQGQLFVFESGKVCIATYGSGTVNRTTLTLPSVDPSGQLFSPCLNGFFQDKIVPGAATAADCQDSCLSAALPASSPQCVAFRYYSAAEASSLFGSGAGSLCVLFGPQDEWHAAVSYPDQFSGNVTWQCGGKPRVPVVGWTDFVRGAATRFAFTSPFSFRRSGDPVTVGDIVRIVGLPPMYASPITVTKNDDIAYSNLHRIFADDDGTLQGFYRIHCRDCETDNPSRLVRQGDQLWFELVNLEQLPISESRLLLPKSLAVLSRTDIQFKDTFAIAKPGFFWVELPITESGLEMNSFRLQRIEGKRISVSTQTAQPQVNLALVQLNSRKWITVKVQIDLTSLPSGVNLIRFDGKSYLRNPIPASDLKMFALLTSCPDLTDNLCELEYPTEIVITEDMPFASGLGSSNNIFEFTAVISFASESLGNPFQQLTVNLSPYMGIADSAGALAYSLNPDQIKVPLIPFLSVEVDSVLIVNQTTLTLPDYYDEVIVRFATRLENYNDYPWLTSNPSSSFLQLSDIQIVTRVVPSAGVSDDDKPMAPYHAFGDNATIVAVPTTLTLVSTQYPGAFWEFLWEATFTVSTLPKYPTQLWLFVSPSGFSSSDSLPIRKIVPGFTAFIRPLQLVPTFVGLQQTQDLNIVLSVGFDDQSGHIDRILDDKLLLTAEDNFNFTLVGALTNATGTYIVTTYTDAVLKTVSSSPQQRDRTPVVVASLTFLNLTLVGGLDWYITVQPRDIQATDYGLVRGLQPGYVLIKKSDGTIFVATGGIQLTAIDVRFQHTLTFRLTSSQSIDHALVQPEDFLVQITSKNPDFTWNATAVEIITTDASNTRADRLAGNFLMRACFPDVAVAVGELGLTVRFVKYGGSQLQSTLLLPAAPLAAVFQPNVFAFTQTAASTGDLRGSLHFLSHMVNDQLEELTNDNLATVFFLELAAFAGVNQLNKQGMCTAVWHPLNPQQLDFLCAQVPVASTGATLNVVNPCFLFHETQDARRYLPVCPALQIPASPAASLVLNISPMISFSPIPTRSNAATVNVVTFAGSLVRLNPALPKPALCPTSGNCPSEDHTMPILAAIGPAQVQFYYPRLSALAISSTAASMAAPNPAIAVMAFRCTMSTSGSISALLASCSGPYPFQPSQSSVIFTPSQGDDVCNLAISSGGLLYPLCTGGLDYYRWSLIISLPSI